MTSKLFQRPASIGLSPQSVESVRITTPLTLTSLFIANGNPYGSVASADLVIEDQWGEITNVQTLYVDASLTPSPFFLYFPESQQTIWIQAKSQGYYPFACGAQVQIQAYAECPGGSGYSVDVQFLNVPVQPCVWTARDTQHVFVYTVNNTTGAALIVPTNGGVQVPVDFNVNLLGFDWSVLQCTAAANTEAYINVNQAVTGWGGVINNFRYIIELNANGSGMISMRYPVPGLCSSGGNTGFTVSTPALAGTCAQNQLVIYWTQS